MSHSGSSVNDYFIVSLDFPESKIVQVHVSPRVESQHMPVSLTLKHGTPTLSTCNCWPSHCSHKTRLARQPDTNIPNQCQFKCVYKYSGRGDWRACTRSEQSAWRICVSFAERCWVSEKNIAGRGNDISSEEWLAHFKSVFGTHSCEDNLSEITSEDDNDDTHASEYDAELNQDLREDEVRAAIKK